MKAAALRLQARLARAAALLAALFLLMLILDRLSFYPRSLFLQEVRNFGHVPLFGAAGVILFWLLRSLAGDRFGRIPLYVAALAAAAFLGALTEFLQYFTRRNADLADWLRDIAGAASFLALHLAFDRKLAGRERELRSRVRTLLITASVLIIAAAAVHVTIAGAAEWRRRSSFPVLYSFGGHLEDLYRSDSHVGVEMAGPPPGWPGAPEKVARVVFSPSKYPGFNVSGPWADWGGYEALVFDVFSPADSSITLNILVKDLERAVFSDRYNGSVRIEPGLNRVRIPMPSIESAPAERKLDLSAVEEMIIFVVEPKSPVTLYFDRISLE